MRCRATILAGAMLASLSGCNSSGPTTTHLLNEGVACQSDSECVTTLCLAEPGASKVCHRRCSAGCTSTEICETFGTDSTGVRAACVADKSGLCKACTQDADCPYPADVCLTVSGGLFCGRDCSNDGKCPPGYQCIDATDFAGDPAAKQCVPVSGTCDCTPATIGQKRPCTITNSFGRCPGQESCNGTAYVGCDARVPMAEVCNGIDDDCNGQTDEGLPAQNCGKGECQVSAPGCVDGKVPECTPKDPQPEICDGKDNNCDGQTDEGFNLQSDVDNCGKCGNQCAPPGTTLHGTLACVGGECVIKSCDFGYADCDLKYENGCEADLATDTGNCSVCGVACSLPYATAKCAAGKCEVAQCEEGHWDVNGDPNDGCEYLCVQSNNGIEICDGQDNNCNGKTDEGFDTTTDVNNCGACGNKCPIVNGTPACVASQCTLACATGYADCNAQIPGCETDIFNSNDNCGGCGLKCQPANASAQCKGGVCTITSCPTGRLNCNNDASDGCETDINGDVNNCGACGNVCATEDHASATCQGGKCVYACSGTWAACNSTASSGCEIDTSTDVNNCGACGVQCPSRDNTTVACSASKCVYACTTGWQNCSSDPTAGCKTNITNDPNNCGSCGHTCPTETNAAAACTASACDISCNPGWANCNANINDGCEVNLDTSTGSPTTGQYLCTSPTEETPIYGDHASSCLTSSPVIVSDTVERSFHFTIQDDTTFPTCYPAYLSAQVELDSPPGVRYGLFLSGPCGSGQAFEPTAAGQPLYVDNCACTDSFHWITGDTYDLYVEVFYVDGTGCGPWKLTVTGGADAQVCDGTTTDTPPGCN